MMGWGGLSNKSVSKCQKMSSCQKDAKISKKDVKMSNIFDKHYCDIKIDFIMSEPHSVKVFCEPSC